MICLSDNLLTPAFIVSMYWQLRSGIGVGKLKTILLLLGAGVIRYAVDKDYTLACAVLVGLVLDFSGAIFIT